MSRKLVKQTEEQPKETIRLSGRNIYTDKQNRTIYYDWVTKKGYLVGSKDAQAATFYKNRFAVILIAAILFAATFLTVTQAVVAGAVMLAAAEIAYRRSFLKKLEPVEDVDFERRVTALQYIVNEKSKGQALSLAVLYLLAAVLVVLNALDQKYGTGLLVLSGLIALIALYFSVLHFIGLAKISQKENQKTGRK